MPDSLLHASEHSLEAYRVARSARHMREAAKDLAALAAASPDAAELAVEIRRTALRIDALRRRLMSRT